MSCFLVNGTGSFTLKLDESSVPVKTILGFTLEILTFNLIDLYMLS